MNHLASGTYSASVIDENNCTTIVEFSIVDLDIAPIETQDSIDIRLYPIPANHELNIQIDKASDMDYMLRIMSIDGKVVFSEVIMPQLDTNISLNSSKWADGLYYVSVIDKEGNTIRTKEIIIYHR